MLKMFKYIRYALASSCLMLPLLAQAGSPCVGLGAGAHCDITFTKVPTFTNFCFTTTQTGTYTIQNNYPGPLGIKYIQIQKQAGDTMPDSATAFTSNCGTSLAKGASCDIVVTLQPLAIGTFNRVLQVGIDTRQVEADAPPITTSVQCTPPGPPPPPSCTVGVDCPIPLTSTLIGTSILAGQTVTNTGPTLINGNLDLSPGSAVTGFPPGMITNGPGSPHINDSIANQAQIDAGLLYISAAGLPCPLGHDLTGQDLGSPSISSPSSPLAPGVYCFSSTAGLTGNLYLGTSSTDAYVFQIGSALTTASGSPSVPAAQVILLNGMSNGNITWAVGSSATLGTYSTFAGTIVTNSGSITLDAGAVLTGRALAQTTGAVTLDDNKVNPSP